jgi:hypothetical protein
MCTLLLDRTGFGLLSVFCIGCLVFGEFSLLCLASDVSFAEIRFTVITPSISASNASYLGSKFVSSATSWLLAISRLLQL